MKRYVNIIPFTFMVNPVDDDFIPEGTTFVLIGADPMGFILKTAKEVKSSKLIKDGLDLNGRQVMVHPDVLSVAFREVEELEL